MDNVYEVLINSIAAVGMDIQNLDHADSEEERDKIMERMTQNNRKAREATLELAQRITDIDMLINKVYPTAYWHRQQAIHNVSESIKKHL